MLRHKIKNLMGMLIITLVSFHASADPINIKINSKRISKEQKEIILNHNAKITQTGQVYNSGSTAGLLVQRPVAEYEDTGYLVFFSETEFNSADVKAKLIQNLPKDVTAIIYTDSNDQTDLEALYRFYSDMAPNKDQIKVIHIPNTPKLDTFTDEDGQEVTEEYYPTGFWSRDAIPVPVVQLASGTPIRALAEKFTVVDAKYYHEYEPDKYIAEYFNAALLSHNYYFEGGNFMVNSKGDCIVINTDEVEIIPNSIFSKTYGCKNLMRMPYVKGIGHADESFKFISDTHVLTDHPKYKSLLEAKGFKVTMLPRPKRDYETYVNSLIINGVVWVPVYQQSTDQKALDVYKSLGLNVVAADSSILSNEGAGSIHCITMTYPRTTDFNELLESFGVEDVIDYASMSPAVENKVYQLKKDLDQQIQNLKDPALDKYLDELYRGWF